MPTALTPSSDLLVHSQELGDVDVEDGSQGVVVPGRIIGGRYRLESPLVDGGLGSVWRAQHCTLQTPVAVKFIDPNSALDEAARTRFINEARSSAALRSTHIVQVLDFGLEGTVPYIAMEMLDGESLAERIERGPISPKGTATILTEVARAMRYAHHEGVVHRDLKPDNVFLAREDGDQVVKVLDFGVAKVRPDAPRIRAERDTQADPNGEETEVLGSPPYLSPEQVSGEGEIDHRTDLWAMGVIVFECLTGNRPFHAHELKDLLIAICLEEPRSLEDVILGDASHLEVFQPWFEKALAKNPEHRFQTAREMADSFHMVVYGKSLPISTAPPRGAPEQVALPQLSPSPALPHIEPALPHNELVRSSEPPRQKAKPPTIHPVTQAGSVPSKMMLPPAPDSSRSIAHTVPTLDPLTAITTAGLAQNLSETERSSSARNGQWAMVAAAAALALGAGYVVAGRAAEETNAAATPESASAPMIIEELPAPQGATAVIPSVPPRETPPEGTIDLDAVDSADPGDFTNAEVVSLEDLKEESAPKAKSPQRPVYKKPAVKKKVTSAKLESAFGERR